MAEPRSNWAPVGAFALVSSANQVAWLTFAPITTGAAEHYRVGTSTVGLLSEVFPLVYVLAALPAARALGRSLRGGLGAGAVLSAAGALLRLGGTGRAGFAWCLAGQIVVAAGQPLLLNGLVALTQRYLAPADRPTGIAVGSAGTFLGFVLAFTSGAAFGAARVGELLVLDAAYCVVGAVVLGLSLAGPAYERRAIEPAGLAELRRLWADEVMRRLVWLVFVGFGVFVALVTWAQPLLQPAGVSSSTVGAFLTVMVLAGVVSSAFIPPVVARQRRQLPALVMSGLVTIAGCLLLAAAPGVMSAAATLAVVGLCLLPGMPVMLEVAERCSPSGAAIGAGLLWWAGNAGGIVIAGAIGAIEGSPSLAFVLMATCIVMAAPAALRLRGQLAPG
ncbi:MAG TPA: MFS transporter [Acidimicrobiales bacterium]|nr:MFS transporter [Acidimicrobiales bacterium]